MRIAPPPSARDVAGKLRRRGVEVIDVTEGDDEVDGMVTLSASVHVQVPTFGGPLSVMRCDEDDTFTHWPARATLAEIIGDIAEAKELDKTGGENVH